MMFKVVTGGIAGGMLGIAFGLKIAIGLMGFILFYVALSNDS